MKISRLALLALALAGSAAAVEPKEGIWKHMHPGGGGQVQGVTFDPNIPGRIYECSDVEGLYVSDDWGYSWRPLGRELIHHMVFYVRPKPGDSRTLYAGSLYGLSKSTDAGQSWQTLLGGYASAAMDFDPFDPEHVIFGHSWLIKDSQLPTQAEQPLQATTGERFVMRSADGGKTLTRSDYTAETGYKQVYTVAFNPVVRGEVYLGAYAGVFRSRDGGVTWHLLKAPAGVNNPGSMGAAVTPDGKYLVATWGTRGNTAVPGRPYVAPISALVAAGDAAAAPWQLIDALAPAPGEPANGVLANGQWWSPKVDPRSGRAEHGLAATYKILLAGLGTNSPLMEGTFTENAGSSTWTGAFAAIFARPDQDARFTFDLGWNSIGPNTRQNAYAPLSWDAATAPDAFAALGTGKRRVLVSNNQQVFLGNADLPFSSWQVLTNRFVGRVGNFSFYRTPGIASTVNFDMDAYQNYYVQGMADNGFFESYDGGYSWGTGSVTGAGGTNQANGDAVVVAPPRANVEEPAIALVGTAPGFGGGADTAVGTLRAKVLSAAPVSNMGPATWRAIAGEAGGTGGLTGSPRIWYLQVHPADANNLYVGTQNGLFFTDDLRARVAGTGGELVKIAATAGRSFKFGRIFVDPSSTRDKAVLYLRTAGAGGIRVHQLARDGATFTLTDINLPTAMSESDDFAYWRTRSGFERLVYSDTVGSVYLKQRAPGQADWSEWTRILDEAGILAVYQPSWWNWAGTTPTGRVETKMEITLTGLVGYEDNLYVGSYVPFGKHGLSMLKASLTGSGQARWSDWTGELRSTGDAEGFMTVPRLWRAKLIEPVPGEVFYAAASRGGGLIVRQIDSRQPLHRFANASARASSGAGPETLILGFSVTGEPRRLLVRAAGPTLTRFGVGNPASDPALTVFEGTNLRQQVDGWGAAEASAADAVGAFPFSSGGLDAAIVREFAPGVYSVHLQQKGTAGTALAEVYDLDHARPTSGLVNVSMRGKVAAQGPLIAGFVIPGDFTRRVLVRGIGPGLRRHGLTAAVSAVTLTVYNSSGDPVGANAIWNSGAGTAELTAAAAAVGAFPLVAGDADAALLLTLAPGAYTVHLASRQGAAGVGLLETYEVL